MKALADRTDALGIYTAGKAADERIYLYGLMALEHLSQQHNPVRCTAHPVRYDGFRWSYHAYRISDTQYPIRGLGREQSANKGSRGTYQHISYHFGGFAYREMMLSDQINVCEDILRGKPSPIRRPRHRRSNVDSSHGIKTASCLSLFPHLQRSSMKRSPAWRKRILRPPSACTRARYRSMWPDIRSCFLRVLRKRSNERATTCF